MSSRRPDGPAGTAGPPAPAQTYPDGRVVGARGLTLTFKLLSLYFTLFVASSLACFVLTFAMFYKIIEDKENEIVRDELHQLLSKSHDASFDEMIDLSQREIIQLGSDTILIRLHEPGRDVLLPGAGEWLDYARDMPADPEAAEALNRIDRIPSESGDDTLKLGTIRAQAGYVIQVGYKSQAKTELFEHSIRVFNVILLPILVLGLGVGLVMAKKAVAGIARVRQTALDIYRGDLEKRVERTYSGDEVDNLSEAFNLMLGRIQSLIANMRRMLDNVAHDLRTPLARLRGRTEMALAQDLGAEDYRKLLESCLGEYDAIVDMINAILNLSEAEAGTMMLNKGRVDLTRLLDSVHEFFLPLAEEGGIEFVLDREDGLVVTGDLERLRLVALNILDNAFKFTPAGGTIRITAARRPGAISIDFADTGAGIGEDDLPHIFQPFYRSDRSRSRKGYGLGLSLVKAVVALHGGTIEASGRQGGGAVFSVRLPALRPGNGKA